jgi:hypothetical protein
MFDICNMRLFIIIIIIINFDNRQYPRANEQLQPIGRYVIHDL